MNMRQSSARQSVAPGLRQSHLPLQPVNPAAAAKLLEKKKEFELVQALEKASTNFAKRIESLGDDFNVMADAGTGKSKQCVWLHVFSAFFSLRTGFGTVA